MVSFAGTDPPSVPDPSGVSSPAARMPALAPVTVLSAMSLPPGSNRSMPMSASSPVRSFPLMDAAIAGDAKIP